MIASAQHASRSHLRLNLHVTCGVEGGSVSCLLFACKVMFLP